MHISLKQGDTNLPKIHKHGYTCINICVPKNNAIHLIQIRSIRRGMPFILENNRNITGHTMLTVTISIKY